MNRIESGNISYSNPVWKKITNEAVILINKMLTYNYKERISAQQALDDPWFHILTNHDPNNIQNIDETINVLKEFNMISTMKKAVLSFMGSHITRKNEEVKLREIFKALDKDHNGTLSVQEMTEGYKLIFNGDEKMAKAEAQRTMNAIDDNQNGEIDYDGNFQTDHRIFVG